MHTDNLTLESVIKLAVLMEERGAKFYSTLESKAGNPGVKEMMHRLAEEEKHHSRQFTRLLSEAGALVNLGISSETRVYLDSLQGKDFFRDFSLTGSVEVPDNPKEAIALGIEAEKNSILFYHELYQSLPAGEARDAVGKLLREEKLHLVELREYIEEM
ncbi:MAG: ferritin family protein [Firmicutes bacterium]|nr:ferritin family protein [Bacillota bacterium]